jgi:HSP20 family molecular chaperone IbpA
MNIRTIFGNDYKDLLNGFGPTVFDWKEPAEKPYPIEAYESETGYILRIDVPGTLRENIDIEANRDSLKVSFKRSRDTPMEFKSISFETKNVTAIDRTVYFKPKIDPDTVEAKLVDGVLEISVKKIVSESKKKILIS